MKQTAVQAKEPIQVNGLNVTALFQIVDALKADSTLARFQFRATNEWLDGAHNRSRIQSFMGCGIEDSSRSQPFVLDADEPPVLLGSNAAANPGEHLLHALAACLTSTLVFHAAARGIEVGAIDSALEGDIDLRGFLGLSAEVRKGYSEVRVRMRVKSAASPQMLTDLAQFSSVYEMVSNSVPVKLVIETY